MNMKRLFLIFTCFVLTLFCGCLDVEHVPSDNMDVPPTLLPGQSMVEDPVDADYFFRDCDGRYSKYNQICYSEAPWDEGRSFTGQQERLIEKNVIPELTGYNDFSGSVYYDINGDFYEIDFAWQNHSEIEPKYLKVSILQKKPEDFELYDGFFTPAYDHMTATEVDGVTVYTEAITDPEGIPGHLMVFTLPDEIYIQIEGSQAASYADTVVLLEHFLEHGVHYELLTKEQGDKFISYSYFGSEPPQDDPYKNCVPDISGLPLIETFGSTLVKNDTINYSLTLNFSLNERDGGRINWDVYTEPPYFVQDWNLGPLQALTEEDILSALEENKGAIAFQTDGYWVSIFSNPIPHAVVLAMIETLPDFQKEEVDYSDLFADNEAQTGDMPGICGTGAPPSRDFSESISTLIAENAIPVVKGGSTPTVKVEYIEEEPCHIWMKWQEGLEVVILPSGFREGYTYVVDEAQCSSHNLGGFTVYADGTENSEKKALITTFPDGTTLQVVGDQKVSANVVGQVLRYFLEHGINYDAYRLDKGDIYDLVAVDELPDYFQHLIPETPEDWYLGSVRLRIREDAPILAELTYYHDGMALEWTILTETEYMRDDYLNNAVNDLEKLTAADVENHWNEADFVAGCFHGGLYLSIRTYQDGLAEALYQMMQSVIK